MATREAITVPSTSGNGAKLDYQGGVGIVACYTSTGTFGSGTVKLQWTPDNGTTYLDAVDVFGAAVSFSANGHSYVHLPTGFAGVRANVAGSTGNVDVTMNVSYLVSNTLGATHTDIRISTT